MKEIYYDVVVFGTGVAGEAAGTAAALCAERGLLPKDLPYDLLTMKLHTLPPAVSLWFSANTRTSTDTTDRTDKSRETMA